MSAVTRPSTLRVAALQLGAPFGEAEENRQRLVRAIKQMDEDLDLVVAPELVITGYDLEGFERIGRELAEPVEGPTVAALRPLAADHGAVLMAGILEAGDDGLIYDTVVAVQPDGAVSAYRKSHLYPLEEGHFAAGDQLMTIPCSFGRLGVAICFEHAFPEIFASLALDGAVVIAIPSAVGDGYRHLLTLRSRARAQDNQLFVVAANLTRPGFCGGSLIADPRGEVLAEADYEEGLVVAELDFAVMDAEREHEPTLQLRRTDLYR
jgi:predicted amidohydrolase